METQRIEHAKKTLADAATALDDQQEGIDAITAKIKALEDLGVLEGKEYWKAGGKYLTVVQPMRDGERKRTYIGNNEAKVQHALDSIDRWKKRRVLLGDRETMESKLSRMVQRIDAVQWHDRWPGSLVTH